MWITTAWQSISPEVTVKGFKVCCLNNAVDGTDHMLWNGSEEDANIRSEYEEDEGTASEDGESDTDRVTQNLTCFVY
jgi:hypothetical protein